MATQQDVLQEIIEDLGLFMEENFVPLVIMLVLFFVAIIFLIRYANQRKSADLRTLMTNWGNIKTRAYRITKNISLRICPAFGNEFQVNGEIYLVDSYVEKVLTEYKPEEQAQMSDKQLEILDEFKQFHPDTEEPKKLEEGKTEVTKDEKTKDSDVKTKDNPGKAIPPEPPKVIVEQKTDTYVYLNTKTRSITGLRVGGLKPTQNILSMAGFMEVGRFDPSRSKIPLYMILVIEAVLNSVLMISMMTEREPSFLFQPEMWGWYALTAAFLGFYFYLDRTLFGHYSIMYAYDMTQEEHEFSTVTGRTFSLLIDVYAIDTYYYPGFRISNVMKVNEDKLRNRIDDERARLITRLTSSVQTARSTLQFKDSLINTKAIELDSMQDQIVKEKAIAYYHGREDASAQPMMPSPAQMGPGQGLDVLKTLMPLLLVGLVLVVSIIGIKILADVIQLDSLQTTLLIIFALVLGVFLLLIGLRSVFESSKRTAM